ncbi:hypothetical protein OW491_14780 [Neptunomonas sp. CHC150]|uniref:hypothetical protein n=1 Tax=Neptunomonas sp. CHC150 TaxID=2998324 RepID=UPI0025B01C9A|nr:hypothetical protein [Neptunomonas sp. CHC150]MDN2661073.1 hypothetical protein [Neptunomonas sp. CHC150]
MLTLILPGKTNNNSYIENLINDLNGDGHECIPFSFFVFMRSAFRADKAILLNWIENQTRQRGFLGYLMVRIFVNLSKHFGFKVFWVRHNFKSHDLKPSQVALNVKMIEYLEENTDKVFCHGYSTAKELGYIYLPHPIYRNNNFVDFDEDLRDYILIFGRIKPYKKVIEALIDLKGEKVLIAGSFDSKYKLEIQDCIEELGLDVLIEDKFLDESYLNSLILNCKLNYVSNDGATSIISGAVYHVLSLGGSVLISGDKLASEYDPELIGITQDSDHAGYESSDVLNALCKLSGRKAIRGVYYG